MEIILHLWSNKDFTWLYETKNILIRNDLQREINLWKFTIIDNFR